MSVWCVRLERVIQDVCICTLIRQNECTRYGVATMSRMLKNTGLFAEYRSLL